MQLESGENKNNTMEVLRLSVADQFEKLVKNGLDIVNYLFTGAKHQEKLDTINKWQAKTGYNPSRINSQKAIVATLYKHNKYYLN